MIEDLFPRIIPLFPLPGTILFPGTYLPLHIFEPRYREMVEDVLETKSEDARLIGMVMLKENWEDDYYRNPPIFPMGCAGRIVQAKRLDDGRYNIVLYGYARFIVKEQFHDKNYRRGWVQPIEPTPEKERRLPDSLREDLVSALNRYAKLRGWEKQIETVLGMKMDDDRLVQVLSSELGLTAVEKQFLLEADDLTRQGRRLTEFLRFMSAEYLFRKEANRPSDPIN